MQSQKFESESYPERRPLPAQSSGMRRLLAASIAALGAVTAEATFLSVQAASLTSWNFDPAANQLEITVKDGTTPRYFLMAQPARIVVDLPDTAVGAVSAQKTYAGAVRQIRVSQFEPGLTRIVMEISPGVSLAPGQVKLQKVGNDAARSGNSRWLLQPLITKSLSANTVAVKPLAPTQSRTRTTAPTEPVAKPSTRPATIAPAEASTADTKIPIAQTKPLDAASKIPSPPVASNNQSPASASPATDDRKAKPAVVVPGITTVPPVALAPVPSSPTSEAQTATPLPPVVAPPVDPNVAVDTRSGVAIAVPTPAALSPTTSLSADGAPIQPPLVAPTKPVDPAPRSATPTPRSASSPSSVPTTVKPPTATVANRSTPPSTTTPAPAATSLSALDVPTTLAAASSEPKPSVSVPPLSAGGGAAPSTIPAQSRQPDTAEAPPGVPTSFNAQPNVSVPPPIRVGTPSLGLPTIASPVVEAAPPVSVFSPNMTPTPPVEVPLLQQTLAPTTVQSGVAPTSYDANTVRQPSASSSLAPPLNSMPLQTPQPTAATVPSTTPGYDATTVRQPPSSSASVSIVEFGQPLPVTSLAFGGGQPFNSLPNASDGVRQTFKPSAPNVLLPAGTTLNLSYPGNSTLMLKADRPQQEILVLSTELRDISGNVLAPAGSTVTGRFETTTSGSQFVTQAIVVAGRTVPLAAQSEAIDGSRKVEGNNLALNSGIGVLAGGVLGAIGGSVGLGALGGAAAGAATTLLIAPKPATIQPGQIVQVRLTQDLRSAE